MFLIPLLSAAAAIGVLLFRKEDVRPQGKTLLIITAAQYGVLCAIYYLLRHFAAASDGNLPLLPVIVTSLLFYVPVMLKGIPDAKPLPFVKKISIAAAVLILAECFVMNLKSFTREYRKEEFLPGRFTCDGNCETDGDTVVFNGDGSIVMEDLPDYTRAIVVKSRRKKDKENTLFHVVLGIKDDNFSKNFTNVQETYEIGGSQDMRFSIDPYGTLYAVSLKIDSLGKPVTLLRIDCMNCFPFAFSTLRFFLLFLLCALVIAVVEFRWYTVCYQPRKPLHIGLVAVTVLICTLTPNLLSRPGEKPVEYEKGLSSTDPFIRVFDSFERDMTWLDVEVDPELLNVENPYDRNVRDASGAKFLWDYSFYNGHFYCYFGATPVITYHYPYYFLHHKLPTFNMGTLFFSRLAVLFLCLMILEFLRRFHAQPNFLLLLLSLFTASVVTGPYWFTTIGGMYNLPNASGQCFLFLCLWTGLLACRCKKMPVRVGLLLLSGAALAFCAGARPPYALSSLVLVPCYVGILLDKQQKWVHRLIQAAAFVAPVCIGAGLIMHYNQIRFGSPFDFGATHQLTVSNINANKMRLRDLWGAVYEYYFLAPRPKTVFPFFEPSFGNLYNFRHYTYVADTVGWMHFPFMALGTLLMPRELVSKELGETRCHASGWQRRAILVICFVMPLLLAWFDFCMGGVNERYYFDCAPLLVLGCMAVLFRSFGTPEKNRYFYGIVCLSVIAAFCLMWLILIGYRDSSLSHHCQTLYNTVEELVVFWQ
ncbi:MAG: hypothetical protein K6F80_00690 [Oscillospiraceae bacterium]|nr:hypothetical protein [Oscillospiraceae bacterium]